VASGGEIMAHKLRVDRGTRTTSSYSMCGGAGGGCVEAGADPHPLNSAPGATASEKLAGCNRGAWLAN